ncbi:hypothetical protein [Brevundimonas sp. SL130]|uniref:hypothetical protein n=1 Tax=Brevundimonas sp. SL130 TaxID=2995143 RepID=UPI00226D2404|nr:hypothetical protein [Brevundimonas sp. SL130]WAC60792.1 hypothetical protein OU998_04920 [Brevundimonas sp. SL130]
MHHDVQPEGVYLHLAVYTAGEAVTTLPDPGAAAGNQPVAAQNAGDGGANALQAQPPPPQRQYADATLLYLVFGDTVLSCRSGTSSDSYLVSWVNQAAVDAQIIADHYRFDLSDRTDVDKVARITRDGISSVTFNGAASQTAVDAAQRDTTKEGLIGAVLDQLRSFSGAGVGAPAPSPDMKVEVKLTLDKRRAALVTDPLVLAVATQAVADDDEGFKIVTARGETIGADDVKLMKVSPLQALGKHPDHNHGWAALKGYHDELHQP